MTTQPTHPRPVTTLLLSIAVCLALQPGVAPAGEQILPTASLAVARHGHTATVLADGRVLILGGLDATGPLSAAEIFDPSQKTFSSAGNLVDARYGHTATLLASGRVLIAGGQDATGPVATAEIFDPTIDPTVTNPFRLVAATMGAARAGHTATLRSDGTVLLAGGDTAGTAEIFDPTTETFYTPLMSMTTPRFGHTATPLAEDNVFMVGGGTTSIELFNASSNSFSLWPLGLSQVRSGHSSIPTTSGQLLVIGGDQNGTFELFDPVNGSSPLGLSLGTPTTTANLLANNQILVLGPGISGLFNETSQQLTPMTDTNAPSIQLTGHTATELPTANRQILVAGGIDSSNNLLNSATLYNPAAIATDANDYPPFSYVGITGTGFLPNETVTNQVEEIVGPAAGTNYAPWAVTADTNGGFATTWQVFSDELLDTTLKLSAVGQTSGLRAETEFTDANSSTIVVDASPTGARGGSFTIVYTDNTSGLTTSNTTTPRTINNVSKGSTFTVNNIQSPVNGFIYTGLATFTATAPGGSGGTITTNLTFGIGTTTTIGSGLNPSTYGQSVTFTATVTPASGSTPTGTVTFKDGTTVLGTATLNSANPPVATFTTTSLTASGSPHSITAIYGGDSNFAGSSGTLSGGQQVNPVPVSLSGTRTYDGTTTAAAAILSVANKVGSDIVTVASGSGTLASKNVGSSAITSFGTLALGGTAAGNYTLTGASGSVTITVAILTVTPAAVSTGYSGIALNNTTYSDNTANYSITGFQNGETVASAGVTLTGSMAFNGSTSTSVKNAATYTQALGTLALSSANNNYVMSFSNPTPNNYVITAATLTVTPAAVSTTYSGVALNNTTYSDNTANYSITGFQNGETVSSAGVTLTGSMAFNGSTSTSVKNTGTYTQAVGSLALSSANNNYVMGFSNPVPHNYVITAATLTVTPAAASTAYSGVALSNATYSDNTANYSITGFQNGETVSSTGVTLTGSMAFNGSTSTSVKNTGTYTQAVGSLALSSANNNYVMSFSNPTPNNYVVTAAILTVTPAAVSTGYSGVALNNTTYSENAANYSITGFQNGETVASAGVTLTGSMAFNGSTATSVKNAATYTQALGTLALSSANNNYVMSFSNPTPNNYVITAATLTVTPAAVSTGYSGVTLNNTTYSDNTANYSITGFQNGETVSSAGVTLTGSMAFNGSTSTSVKNTGTYTQAVGTLALGSANNNYVMSFSNPAPHNYVITAATLTVTPSAVSTTYSGVALNNTTYSDNTGNYSITGFQNSETVASAGVTLSGSMAFNGSTATSVKNTGTYTQAVGTLALSSANNNYVMSFSNPTPNNYVITAATLTVTPAAVSTGYSGVALNNTTYSDNTGNYSIIGFQNSETVVSAGVTLSGSMAFNGSTATSVKNAGTYTQAVGTLALNSANNNYVMSFSNPTPNDYAITAATLTVTPKAVSTTYSGVALNNTTYSDNTSDYSITGFQNGETVVSAGVTLSGSMAFNGSTATSVENAATYTQAAGTLALSSANNNYAMSFSNPTPNNYVITTATLTYTANTASRTYGSANPALSGTVTGFVGGDNQGNATTGTLTFSSPATTSSSVGSYAINGSGLTANNGNYTFAQAAGNATALSVTTATLTITANNEAKTYGTTFTPNGPTQFTPSGLVNGDSVTSVTLSSSGYALTATVAGSPYTITPSAAVGTGLGNYTITYATGTLTVNPAALTITAKNESKTYGTTFTPIGTTQFTTSGLVNSDTVTSVTLSSSGYAAIATVAGSPYTITPSAAVGTGLGNYTISYNNGQFTVNTATVTITSGVTANDKAYDGGNTATLSFGTIVFSGVLNGDSVNLVTTGYSATFASTTPAPGIAVSVSGLTLGGTGAGNYTLTQPIGLTANITQKPLTITGITASNRAYNGGTVATLNFSGAALVGIVGTDSVVLDPSSATGAFSDPNVGTAKTVTVSGLALGGQDHKNYTIATPVTTTANITPAALTITANNQSKAYAAALPTLTVSYSGFVNGETSASLTTQPTVTTTATAASPVGSYPITASGAVDSNYTITYVAGSLAVTPVGLTITANNQTKVYGAALPTLTVSYSGFVDGDTAASLTTPPTVTTTATSASHVAGSPYAITASGAADANYTISYVAGSLTVTSAGLTITADSKTKAYGAALPTLTASYSGLVNGDTASSLTTPPTLSSTATAASHVSGNPYSITASGAVDSDYTISYVAGTLTVTPVGLTITADNKTEPYGGPLPALTASYNGFVNGDTASSLTTPPTLTTTATASSHVSGNPYSITASGAVDSDYTISYVAGTLTVTPVPLTITADDQTKDYGAALPTLTASYSGFVNGDSAASLTTQPTVTTAATPSSHVSGNPYSITASGAVDTDYTFSYVAGTLTVTPVPLTITADDQSKYYGAALPTLTASYAGFVNGDSAASLTTSPSLATTATASSHVSGNPYSITASGAVDTDYTITYVAGRLTVNPVALKITADDQTKPYGAALPTLTASYSGFVNGDTSASLMTSPTIVTAATTASHVGTYSITASGAVDSDYTISYVAGTLTVTPVGLTITANNQTKPYGAALPTLTVSYSGFVNSDTSASLTIQPTVTTTATAASHVSGNPYSITASGAVDSDYTITYVAGTLTVTPVGLTITADNKTEPYGGPLRTLTASYSGFVNGDTASSLTTQPTLVTTATTSSHVSGNPYSITASGAVDSDYTIGYVAGTLTVTPVALTITADGKSKDYGADLPTLTASYAGFVNGDSAASLTTPPTLTTTATANSHVSGNPYSITASGAVEADYTISYVAGTLTVTPVPLTITADDQSKDYGAALPTLTASYAGFVNGDSAASLTTSPALVTTATASSHVSGNPYSITASGAVDSDYTITYVAGTLTVNPVALKITADNQTKAYGAPLPTLTASYSGFVNGDTSASLTTPPTLVTTATTASHVGTYSITASGAVDTDYTISYVAGTLTVTPVGLTITANNQTKPYGAALPTLTVSYSGFVNSDTSASLTTQPTVTTTATATSHVSGNPYSITASGAVDTDYTISYVAGTLTVTPVGLTIAADNKTEPYGGPLPALTVSYSGFVNGDTASSLTAPPTLVTTATIASHVSGNPYTITASGAVDSDYTISYVAGTLTVTPVALTITADDKSKDYGADLPTLTASYAGFVNGDSAASLTTPPTLTTTATANSHVSGNPYSITASGAADGDYTIGYVPGTLTVDPVALTITADDKSKDYGAALPSLTVTYTGLVNGDTAATFSTVPNTAPTITTTATASSHVLGSPYSITASGAVDTDYTISYVAGKLTVTAVALTITADDKSKAYGAALPTLTVSYTGLVNGDTAATFGTSPNTAPSISTTATAMSHVAGSPYTITATGAADTDYTISYVAGKLTVTAVALTITADSKTKDYGAPLPTLTASYSGFVNGDNSASLTTLPILATTATAASHVSASPYSITASGAVDSDYTIGYVPGTLTVDPVALTITADGQNKDYGAALPTLTVSYTGLVSGDTAATFSAPPNTAPSISTTATAASHVAGSPYPITATGAVDTDYTISYVDGKLTVLAVALTITADDQTKAYGAALPTLTVTYTGLVNGDTAATFSASPNTAPTITTTATAASHVAGSPYAITASGAIDTDYTISYVAGKLTVTAVGLTITADSKTKAYGAALPVLTASYSGFVNGDTSASLTTQPTLATTATVASHVSGNPYSITASGAADSDYTIGYVQGTLTVTAVGLTITADSKTKAYGAALPALTASYSGFVNGDTSVNLTTQPTLTTTAAAASHVSGNPFSITTSGAVDSDYTISYVDGTLTVTAVGLTITADSKTKAYGAALPALTASYSGFVNGDTSASLTTQLTLTTTATAASHVSGNPYSITASGAVDSDYTISYVDGTLTVTAVGLTVTADSKTKAYGAALPALTASYSGFVNGDTSASLTTQPTLTTAATAASHVSGNPYSITASGAVDTDYTISYVDGTLTVTAVGLTITADSKTKAYGAALPALTASYSGFVNGDTSASLTTQPTLTTTATAASHVSGNPYSITASGAVDIDYTISYVDGTLTVTAVGLTITADSKTKPYGAALPALTASYSGFVNGDTSASLTTQPTLTTTATAASHVAGSPYSITASSAVDSDYTIGYVAGTLTVTSVGLTITADNKTEPYGGPLPTLTASYAGFVNGDTSASLTTQPTLTTTATASSHVSGNPYSITASGAMDTDYTIGYVAGTLTVTPVGLTITANSQTKAYGAALPTLTVSYTGFVNGDASANLATQPTISTTATAASHVAGSPYPITASGAVDNDYTIGYVAGTLTVTPVTLTITADSKTKAYGAALPALTASYSGLVNGDTAASLTTPPTLATTATASSHVAGSPYPITASGAVDTDYAIGYVAGTLTISPVTLTITADSKTKAYGASVPTLTVTYNGLVNGDTPATFSTSPNTAPSISTTATVASHVAGSPYPITATGAVDADYTIGYVAGTLSVTPVGLTITANNQTKAYGAALPALTVTYTGFVNGDTAANLATQPAISTTATAASHVAGSPYPITTSGAVDADYTIGYVAGKLTVTPVALTITANNQTMPFGGPYPAFTATFAGLVNGDSQATFSMAPNKAPTFTTTATFTSPMGFPYTITVSGAVDTDYNITFVNGTLTITGVLSAALEKSKVCFHKDGTKRIEFHGQLTLLGGLIPPDLRSTTVGHGSVTVTVAGMTWYQNSGLVFDVDGVDPNQDTETWEFEPSEQQEVEIEWMNHVDYVANNDPNLNKSLFGSVTSQFIHKNQTEMRWSYGSIPLPATLTWQGFTLATISATGVISPGNAPGIIVDPRGNNKMDIYFGAQLNPGDVVTWTSGANNVNKYTQTIGSGTASCVYYNAGGHFEITMPASQDPNILFTSTPMTAQVTLTLGDTSSTQVSTTFAVPMSDPYIVDGSEHWSWHDIDPDSD